MATQEQVQSISVEASADLSGEQFTFMKIDAAGQLEQCIATEDAAGVLQDKPAAVGRVGTLAYAGRAKVVAGAVVVAGAYVASDATGRAITAAVAGTFILGVALTAAGAADELIEVLLGSQGIV